MISIKIIVEDTCRHDETVKLETIPFMSTQHAVNVAIELGALATTKRNKLETRAAEHYAEV